MIDILKSGLLLSKAQWFVSLQSQDLDVIEEYLPIFLIIMQFYPMDYCGYSFK